MKILFKKTFAFVVILLSAVYVVFHYGSNNKVVIDNYTEAGRLPVIKPDYTEIVIPPNIAPLNFLIKEQGNRYYVKIYSKNGNSIEISSKKPETTQTTEEIKNEKQGPAGIAATFIEDPQIPLATGVIMLIILFLIIFYIIFKKIKKNHRKK